jgi:hypothetical protein
MAVGVLTFDSRRRTGDVAEDPERGHQPGSLWGQHVLHILPNRKDFRKSLRKHCPM